MKTPPTFAYERQYWQQGIDLVAGLDEVGMGAWAGPVVAGAVIFAAGTRLRGIRDSKQLTSRQREQLAPQIKDKAVAWAVAEASVEEISALNIRQASFLAMRRALEQLKPTPELLLIDGRGEQLVPDIPAEYIIKGDAVCLSIAAASILAKVYRDALMIQLGEKYPNYGFAGHKGYGAPLHQQALQQYGPTPVHRPTYAPVAACRQAGPLDQKLIIPHTTILYGRSKTTT